MGKNKDIGKLVDSQVLAALHFLALDTLSGVNYMDLIKKGVLSGAVELMDNGYAKKIPLEGDDANYYLTEKGAGLYNKLTSFLDKEFYF